MSFREFCNTSLGKGSKDSAVDIGERKGPVKGTGGRVGGGGLLSRRNGVMKVVS